MYSGNRLALFDGSSFASYISLAALKRINNYIDYTFSSLIATFNNDREVPWSSN